MTNHININLKYDLTVPMDRIRRSIASLQSSDTSVAFKNPIRRSRVVNTPEDFPPDLILTLLDSSLYKFNGLMADLETLTSFNIERVKNYRYNGERIAKRLQVMAKAKRLERFWTLTFYQELSNVQRMSKFNSFIVSIRRIAAGLQYIGVKELHANGGLHLHLLFDQYIPYERVREVWERLGCGKVVWVKFVPTDRVVAYVTKYITKSIGHGLKRVLLASREMCVHIGCWPKWLMTNILLGNLQYAKYFLDTGAILEYYCIVGNKKRQVLNEVVALL